MPKIVKINAELEPVEVDLERTAVVLIDMQNCFVSKGGTFDSWGEDLDRSRMIIPAIKSIVNAARKAGCKIVYTRQSYSPDLRETGGPDSVQWQRGFSLTYRTQPEMIDKGSLVGSWGYQIIEELKPEAGDLIVDKPKFSGFFGTNLDLNLRTFSLKYLIFTGVATNICVESTIRDAYYHLYWPILVADGCASIGPAATQEATLWNVKKMMGWVTTSEEVLQALKR